MLNLDLSISATEVYNIFAASPELFKVIREHSFSQDSVDKIILVKPRYGNFFVVLHVVEHGDDIGGAFLTLEEAQQEFEQEIADYESASA